MALGVSPDQIDKLTDLPNYQAMSGLLPGWFDEGVEKTELARNPRNRGGVLVIFCDGDGLKAINDGVSHERGNDFIRALVDRLKAHVPTICGCALTETISDCDRHFIARDGGDEFIVIIRDVLTEDAARGHIRTLEYLMNELAFVPVGNRYVFPVTMSLGGAWSNGRLGNGSPDDRRLKNPFSLKEDADTAMRYAKSHRTDGLRSSYFELSMREEASRRERLAALYWRAVRYGEYQIAYMPIVDVARSDRGDLADLAVVAFEALVRLSAPAGLEEEYILSPEDMERVGVTTELVLSFIPRVLDQLLEWQGRYGSSKLPLVFVNVPPGFLVDDRVYRDVMAVLRTSAYGGVKGQLVFEFTEASRLDPTELVHERFSHLKEHVRVALDDFGEGFSNIGTLVEFDWDIVKFDKDFLLRHSDDKARSILRAAAALVADLRPGAKVLVEGIEDESRHRAVGTMCHDGRLPADVLGQGYYYGQAVPETDLARLGLLADSRPTS